MAPASSSSTSSTTTTSSPAAGTSAAGSAADEGYSSTSPPDTNGGADGVGFCDPALTGSQPGQHGAPLAATGLSASGTHTSSGDAPNGNPDDSRLAEPLRAERRRSNQLEKEIRTLRQQLNRFSEINPEEYARLQEAERQKQILEQQMELRERQMKEASAQKVAAVAVERDEARQQVLQLRKDRLLERAFSEAEGRTGGDGHGTFFDIFKAQLGGCFRLASTKDGSDALEPLDAHGKPLLGDDGRPLSTTEFLDQLRLHPVFGFLFQQRGPAGMPATSAAGVPVLGSCGEPLNPHTMSAAELYRVSLSGNSRSTSRR